MTQTDLWEIEGLIGYNFNKKMLLQQAFIRRSYSQEHPGHQNNEVLEFIGDKVLDAAVVRHLTLALGDYSQDNDEYVCDYNEGKLTEFKKRLVCKTMLAHRIDILGLSKYLIMGKGDRNNDVQEDVSVKEDLFEAILGAVALDCSWNWDKIDTVLEALLPIDEYLENGFDTSEDNYVEIVQEWCQKNNKTNPDYMYIQMAKCSPTFPGKLIDEYSCQLSIPDITPNAMMSYPIFTGNGTSKAKARMMAAKQAYDFLRTNNLLYDMADIIGEPELDKAINQLQELAHKGYFSMPDYKFEEKHDHNGNPFWICSCSIAEYEYYYTEESRSKKDAKKHAAYSMLLYVLNPDDEEENEGDDYWDD